MNRDDQAIYGQTIYGLDNVRLELPIASAGSRSLAAALDYCLLGMILVLVSIATIATIVFAVDGEPSGTTIGWFAGIYLLVLLLLEIGYFAGQELLLDGQTLGKKLVRLRVVNARGGRAEPLSLVGRNLLRLIDLFIGMPLMLLDTKARRFGDRIAGTLVIHEPSADSTVAVGRLPAGWGAREVEILEALIDRLETLAPAQAEELSQRLLALAEHHDPGFLQAVPASLPAATRLLVAFGRNPAQTGSAGAASWP